MTFIEQFTTTNNLLNVFLAVRTSKTKNVCLLYARRILLLSCGLNNKSFPIILFEISYKSILIIKIIEKKIVGIVSHNIININSFTVTLDIYYYPCIRCLYVKQIKP